MTAKENQKLQSFLTKDKIRFKETVILVLDQLEKGIGFILKFQKASIQICDKVPFAVLAFRRSKAYFFVEFYNAEKIDNSRIVKSLTISDKFVINRVNIASSDDIDKQLLNWIINSKLIAE